MQTLSVAQVIPCKGKVPYEMQELDGTRWVCRIASPTAQIQTMDGKWRILQPIDGADFWDCSNGEVVRIAR